MTSRIKAPCTTIAPVCLSSFASTRNNLQQWLSGRAKKRLITKTTRFRASVVPPAPLLPGGSLPQDHVVTSWLQGLAADPLYVDLLDAMMDEVESRAHNLGPTYLEAKETTIPVGCDLGRVLDGLGLAREGGAPSHRLRSGGRLYSLLLPVLAEVVYDLNDLRFCRVLSGLSRLQWTPGKSSHWSKHHPADHDTIQDLTGFEAL